MTTPPLSIIIVTWNTAKSTIACIHSIRKHLQNIKTEIIIIDNASTDNTLQLLKAEKNLKIIANSSNLGFSKAVNQGAKASSSPHLLFLNSDIELCDDSIIKMLNFLVKNRQIGAIGPKFLNPNLTPQGSVFPPQSIINAFKEFWLNIPSFSKYLPITTKPTSVWSISGGAILISRQLFQDINGFNEAYFMYYEDLDLCRKIRDKKLEIYFYPECSLIHRHGLSGRKIVSSPNQWRRLIPSSIHYHGLIKHYFLYLVIRIGQKWQKYTK